MWRLYAGMDSMLMPYSSNQLQQTLAQREAARHNGDTTQAERLLKALRAHGIWLNDDARTWTSSDGSSGVYPPFSQGV